jgi:hypothetical protein
MGENEAKFKIALLRLIKLKLSRIIPILLLSCTHPVYQAFCCCFGYSQLDEKQFDTPGSRFSKWGPRPSSISIIWEIADNPRPRLNYRQLNPKL